MDVYAIIEHISSFSVLVPFFLCIYRYRWLSISYKPLAAFLLFGFITDRLYFAVIPDLEIANLVINCWGLLEFFLLAGYFFFQSTNKKIRTVITLIFTFYLIFSIYKYHATLYLADDSVAPLEAALVILYSILFLIKLLLDDKILFPMRNSFFWINTGLLIYFSGSILIFLGNNYLETSYSNDPAIVKLIWGLHHSAGILCNFLITLGIWQSKFNLTGSYL